MEAPRPTSPPSGWMKRALKDFRVLLLDQRGTGRSTPVDTHLPGRHAAGAGRLPGQLPRRFDRARRRADPPGAGRRALERPGPELRRLLLDDVPVDRAAGAARGVHHRRPVTHRPAGRRRLRARLTRAWPTRTGPTSSATRTTGSAPGTSSTRLENEDVRLPGGDRLTARRFRQIGQLARVLDTAWSRSTTCSSCPLARTRSCSTRSRAPSGSSATRSTRRCTSRATPTAASTSWSAARL